MFFYETGGRFVDPSLLEYPFSGSDWVSRMVRLRFCLCISMARRDSKHSLGYGVWVVWVSLLAGSVLSFWIAQVWVCILSSNIWESFLRLRSLVLSSFMAWTQAVVMIILSRHGRIAMASFGRGTSWPKTFHMHASLFMDTIQTSPIHKPCPRQASRTMRIRCWIYWIWNAAPGW